MLSTRKTTTAASAIEENLKPASVDEENGAVESIEQGSKHYYFQPSRMHGWHRELYLGFTSLGAIYGDIGTSPIYTLSSIFSSAPAENDVYGALSCIFWIFTLIVIVKYCLIVLYFGPNNGEGGQIAIYAKIAQALKIGPTGVRLPGEPDVDDMLLITRSETHDVSIAPSRKGGRYNETFINGFLSKFVMALCFFGSGLVMSDGLLTPTTSVLSAISGIAVAKPSFTDKVLPVSCVVLIALFAIQRYSSKISFCFAPIIFIWLICLAINGIVAITDHPGVFKSLNPKEAIDFLKREGGVDKLGAIMLAITGTEAMFADVGHFSRISIQATLGLFVYPCLILAYLGQGSYLIDHPDDISNVFFLSIPGGINGGYYWVMFVLSTLACIIASQALIIGVFSILRQMIHVDCFPPFKVVHKSVANFGQVYLPTINFYLMVAVVLTCVGFENSANVTGAYGLGIALDFFITTNLIAICLLYVYEVPILVVLFFYLVFGALDMVLVVSGMAKVPHGAWFPLSIGFLFFIFFCLWRWGRAQKINQEYNDRVKLRNVFVSKKPAQVTMQIGTSAAGFTADIDGTASAERVIDDVRDQLIARLPGGKTMEVQRYEGVGIMHTDIMHTLNFSDTVPALFQHIVTSFPSIPNRFVFLGVRIASVPYVGADERLLLEPIRAVPGFYRCIVKYGFMDKVAISNAMISEILLRIDWDEIDEEEVPDVDSKDQYLHENGDLKLSVLHLYEREVVTAKQFANKVADAGSFKRLVLTGAIWVRSLFIEKMFGPVSNLFDSVDRFLDVSTDQEVLYVGTKVQL